ncbi:hypothetical protein [Roseateles sp.]|uniref:hypothetical protein n=1 Tax=Roseateles sp. TaxID=1971397 RepID=UPI002E07B587|nr:hypothetical protein [Roseateles sp.]
MPPAHFAALSLPLAGLALLAACRKEVPTPTVPPAEPTPSVAPSVTPSVTPSSDLRGASDHPQAPPAIGAVTPSQDGGATHGGSMPPTAGDGRAASAASAASGGAP